MIIERTKVGFVSPAFRSCNTCTVSFDIWMSKGGVDTFFFIVHFLNDKWEPCHVIIGFFETTNTSKNAMAMHVSNVLAKHGLNILILAYVKDERNNLATMTFTLTSIVCCEILGLLVPLVGSCRGHVMSKCCQYATD